MTDVTQRIDGSALITGDASNDIVNAPGGGGIESTNKGDFISVGDGDNVINAGAGDDTIYTGSGADTINAGDGNDYIKAGAGNDVVAGGAGDDRIYGEAGDDTLHGNDGNDQIHGGDGADTLYGDAGDDKLYGDAGNDILNGGAGNDTLYGGANDDTLHGGDGNDKLYGGDGADSLYGDAGNDVINGGAGNDTLTGGLGNDTFAFDSGHGNDTITDFEPTNDKISLQQGTFSSSQDALNHVTYDANGATIDTGNGNSIFIEGAAQDSITADTFNTPDGDSLLDGSKGNDTLITGLGNDTINGGAGNDIINGGAGNDILTGGAGNDTFVFNAGNGNDTITDFKSGEDALHFGKGVFKDSQDALNHTTYDKAGAHIDTGNGNSVFIKGAKEGDINADNIAVDDASSGIHITPIDVVLGALSAGMITIAVGAFSYVNARKEFTNKIRNIAKTSYDKMAKKYAKENKISPEHLSAEHRKIYAKEEELVTNKSIQSTKNAFVDQVKKVWTFYGGLSGIAISASIATTFLAPLIAAPALAVIAVSALSLAFGAATAPVSRLLAGQYAEGHAREIVATEISSETNKQGVTQFEVALQEEKIQHEQSLLRTELEKAHNKAGTNFSDKFPKKDNISEILERGSSDSDKSHAEKEAERKNTAETSAGKGS